VSDVGAKRRLIGEERARGKGEARAFAVGDP
jgi:hypothetical protein